MTFSVASVLYGQQGQAEVSHAMVLDIFDWESDMLIFKNTYDDEENGQSKQFETRRTSPNAPEELYFVHIEVKDMAGLPQRVCLSDTPLDYYSDSSNSVMSNYKYSPTNTVRLRVRNPEATYFFG